MKQQKTETKAIVFMIVSAFLASFGQIFYKFAANNTSDVYSFFANPYLYFGGLAYFIGLIFMIKALRRGELTIVYPILATSFIWVSLLTPFFFSNDVMTLRKWIGVIVIVVGVICVGSGRAK